MTQWTRNLFRAWLGAIISNKCCNHLLRYSQLEDGQGWKLQKVKEVKLKIHFILFATVLQNIVGSVTGRKSGINLG
jgi:hypothetical protein